MLDVYSDNNQLLLYHGVTELGFSFFEDVLNDFKTFIDSNPTEVITLILEDYSPFSLLSDALFTSGIIEDLYQYDEAYGWPTLQEMINLDRRVVLFSDNEVQNPPSWFHFCGITLLKLILVMNLLMIFLAISIEVKRKILYSF